MRSFEESQLQWTRMDEFGLDWHKLLETMAWLVEVGGHQFLQLFCLYVGPVTVQMCSGFSVSPTYCRPHFRHCIIYSTFLVLHVNAALTLYICSVVWLVNEMSCLMILQVLHPLLSHGVLPGGVGGAVLFNSPRTSRSFKFLGRQKAIKGGSGMACCSLSDRCFLHNLLSLLRVGWYVITSPTLLYFLVLGKILLPSENYTTCQKKKSCNQGVASV